MNPTSATPHRDVSTLIAGHFKQESGYLAWRPQGTQDWLIIHTLAGRGRFGYPGGEYVAEPGQTVLIRPGTPHDYGVEQTLQRWELLWSHFVPRAHWLAWLNWPEISPGLMHLNAPARDRRRIAKCFQKAHQFTSLSARHWQAFAMHALEEAILTCNLSNPNAQQLGFDDRVRTAMDFVCRHLSEQLTLPDIADAAGLSISRLSSLFRQHVGLSPMHYLEAQRIDRARSLLELTSLSVKEISHKVGFASPFYFSLRFKTLTRHSPRSYRREQLKYDSSPPRA